LDDEESLDLPWQQMNNYFNKPYYEGHQKIAGIYTNLDRRITWK
jgi:hypothetical protein